MNEGKKYANQIKPFNFLLTCHVKQLGHPTDANADRFHLIAAYVDPKEWLKIKWIDQYSENCYRITTAGHHGTRYTARVKTYGEVLREYEFHPESKCADANRDVCGKQTIGLLQRRHIQVDQTTYIGKESNKLEDVQSALVHSAQEVYTEYHDPRRDEWQTKTLPALKRAPLSVFLRMSGLSRRAIMDLRAERSRPHPKNQEQIATVLREMRYL